MFEILCGQALLELKNCEVDYHILKLPQFELRSDLYD